MLESLKEKHLENDFNLGGAYDYIGMLGSQVRGKNDSWAVRWYASAFLANKLTLYPGKSLILNIGMDGSGTHRGVMKVFSGEISERPVVVGGIPIVEDLEARTAIGRFLNEKKGTTLWQVIAKIESVWEKLLQRKVLS